MFIRDDINLSDYFTIQLLQKSPPPSSFSVRLQDETDLHDFSCDEIGPANIHHRSVSVSHYNMAFYPDIHIKCSINSSGLVHTT